MKFSKILFSVIITMFTTVNATDRNYSKNESYVINIPNTYKNDLPVVEHNEESTFDMFLNVVKLISQYPRGLATAFVESAEDVVYAFSVLGDDLSKWHRIQNNAIELFGNCIYNGGNLIKEELNNTYVLENFTNYNN